MSDEQFVDIVNRCDTMMLLPIYSDNCYYQPKTHFDIRPTIFQFIFITPGVMHNVLIISPVITE